MNEIIKLPDEIIKALQSNEFKQYSKSVLPDDLAVPNEDEHTSLIAIDFAICKDEKGNLIPQLIELQGFASLYCYQDLLDEMTRKHFDIGENLTSHFSGLNQRYLFEIT